MKIKVDTAGLEKSRWYEYVVRFAFGGTITALAGIIARRFGPGVGGLFLAFPAILPAAASLIDKHQRERKEEAGLQGKVRGRKAAGVDAAGACMGSVGLIAFALFAWLELPRLATVMVLSGATLVWFVTAISVWELRKILGPRWRRRLSMAARLRTSGGK